MAEKSVTIRLALAGGDATRRDLVRLGDDGQRALERIERAAQPASKSLLAMNAVGEGTRGMMEGMAGRLGLVGEGMMAMGAAGLGAAAGLAAVALALVQGMREAEAADQSMRRLEAVLKATGNASGLTGRQIADMADEMEGSTLTTAEAVMDAAAVLATFRSVAGDAFTRSLRLAQDLAAVFGQDLKSSAVQLGKALVDPVDGITALRRVGVSFTETQRDMIKSMVEAGDVAGAQKVILDALEQQVGGAGEAEGQGLTGAVHHLSAAWGNLLEDLSRTAGAGDIATTTLKGLAWVMNDIRGLLKGPDIAAQVAEKSSQLIAVEQKIAEYQRLPMTGRRVAELQKQADGLRKQIDDLIERGRAEVAAFEAEQQKAEEGRSSAERDRNGEAMAARIKALEAEKVKAATDAAEKISAINAQLANDVAAAQKKAALPGVDPADVDREVQLLQGIAARKIDAIQKPLQDAADRAREQTRKVIDDLRRQMGAVTDSRQGAVGQALARLPKEATEADRSQAAKLAGELFDQKKAVDDLKKALEEEEKVREKGRQMTLQHGDAEAAYAVRVKELNDLLAAGAISQDTYTRAVEDSEKRKLAASRDWNDGVKRAMKSYVDETTNSALAAERFTQGVLKSGEDFFVNSIMRRKATIADFWNFFAEQALRAAYQVSGLGGFFAEAFGGGVGIIKDLLGGGGGSSAFAPDTGVPIDARDYNLSADLRHVGGVLGMDRPMDRRTVPASLFNAAPRFHAGGLLPGERAIIAQDGEGIFTPRQMDNADALLAAAMSTPPVVVKPTVYVNAPGVTARTQSSWNGGELQLEVIVEEVEAQMGRNIGRGNGLAPVMERRYGLNPAAGVYG